MNSFSGNGIGNKTAAAGTAITFLIPPHQLGFTRITKLVQTTGNTTHNLTHLRPIGKTQAYAASAAGINTVNTTAEMGATGNALAANDLVAIRETDNVTRLYTVSAVPAGYPNNVTFTANLTAGVAQGAKMWNFGLFSDTDPVIGMAHPSVRGIANTTTSYEDREGGIFAGHEVDSPILFYSANGTNAGTLEQLSWGYTGQ